MSTALRHRCRNPRCRAKLTAPVENKRHAFCCHDCHDQFYRARCLVCERDTRIDPMTGKRRARRHQYCGRKCKSESARFPHVYRAWPPKGVPQPVRRASDSKSAHSTGLKIGIRHDQRGVIGPAHVIAAEVLADRVWQDTTSSDGVAIQVSRLRQRALVERTP
jgi:hypothetical protein